MSDLDHTNRGGGRMSDWIILAGDENRIEVTDAFGSFRISLAVDDEHFACSHVHDYSNGATPFDPSDGDDENTDYLHICDFGEFIEQMQSLDRLRAAFKAGEVGITDCPHEHIASHGAKRWCQACGASPPDAKEHQT